MNDIATSFLIQQQARSYASALRSWSLRVRSTRALRAALLLASQKPAPGSLIRGLSHVLRQDENRATQEVERHLSSLLDTLTPQDKDLPVCLRLSQGHWPRINKALHEMSMQRPQP